MAISMAFATSLAALISAALGQQFVQYTPGGDDTLVERADPILNPGGIASHVHQIFGASGFSLDATYDSLQQSSCTTVGSANGYGNSADKSIYWIPALYMEASDGSGYVKVPTNTHKLYYRNAGSNDDQKADPFEFPEGFRMIAGESSMRSADPDLHRQNITQWICHNSGPWAQGTAGGFPDGVKNCDAYPGFNGAIHFPHCWNKADFDPSNPTAHMSYPDGDIEEGKCPSSHPVRLPHIFMENEYDVNQVIDKVKPGKFYLAQGDPTGYGFHADFVNGWKKGAIPSLLASCPQDQYGNEDIGLCPTFEKFATPSNNCTLSSSFDEDVEAPGKELLGCNPITTQNPAPGFKAAPNRSNACVAAADDREPVNSSPSVPEPSSRPSLTLEASSSAAAMSSETPSSHAVIPLEPSSSPETSSSTTISEAPSPTTPATLAHMTNGPHFGDRVVTKWHEDVVYVTEFVTVYG